MATNILANDMATTVINIEGKKIVLYDEYIKIMLLFNMNPLTRTFTKVMYWGHAHFCLFGVHYIH